MSVSTQTHLAERYHELEETIQGEIYERNQEVHTAMLAIAGRKHHFQVGPPGTAKSLLVDRICRRISDLGEEGYFPWLLTNYTTPEELYGGPDFKLLREKGVYKRVTEHKLPRAYFVFMDEIFKANSSILNANLTAMNERKFYNHDDDPKIPLISVFAASNEIHSGNELWALWDRLHFKHVIKAIQESQSFMGMMSNPMDPQPEPLISLEEILASHQEVDSVVIPEDVTEALLQLRKDLGDQGVFPTERKWMESLGIIKAEAFFNGRSEADTEDVRPLMHVLWDNEESIKTVQKIVLQLANPLDKKASDILDKLLGLEYEFDQLLNDADNEKNVGKSAVEIHRKVMKCQPHLKDIRKQNKESGRKSEYLDRATRLFKEMNHKVVAKGFNVDIDSLKEEI